MCEISWLPLPLVKRHCVLCPWPAIVMPSELPDGFAEHKHKFWWTGGKKVYKYIKKYICSVVEGQSSWWHCLPESCQCSVSWLFIFMSYFLNNWFQVLMDSVHPSSVFLNSWFWVLLPFAQVTVPKRISSITGTITLAQGVSKSANILARCNFFLVSCKDKNLWFFFPLPFSVQNFCEHFSQ